MDNRRYVIIGYSGHAYVVCDTFLSTNKEVYGYCDNQEKQDNPFGLTYLGRESEIDLTEYIFLLGIGDNTIRRKVYQSVSQFGQFGNAIHNTAVISRNSSIENGVTINAGAIVNALAHIGNAAIVNSGAVVEHECVVSDYAHIAPGAVLAGNVKVGEASFIGANAVVKQGVTIGANVTIGAGSVIIRDIPDNCVVVGNPGKLIKEK